MAATIITTEDLQQFKNELLSEIKEILKDQAGVTTKKWLKSMEVRKLLSISPGTLQNMRVNGTLPFTKIGGVIYYDAMDIQNMLTENRIDNKLQ
ncbi:MAG: helix-turn-helix domain-containing protein [Cyclobacteriaceae bacterium]